MSSSGSRSSSESSLTNGPSAIESKGGWETFEVYSAPPLVEVDGVRVWFSGDIIESESDSVPETAC